MTQRKAIAVVAAFVGIALVAGLLIYRAYADDEMKIYVALLQSFQSVPGMKEVAFLSTVSTCGAHASHMPEDPELLSSLQVANGPGTEPRALEKLSDLANVVSWKDTKYIHEQGGHIREEKYSSKRLIRISRVGFNENRTRAALCMEPSGFGVVLIFEKPENSPWRKVAEHHTWVS